MPHDNLNQYYDRDAKRNAYTNWPADTARLYNSQHPQSQVQVTMSAAVINDIQDFAERGTFSFFRPGWASKWVDAYNNLKTTNGFHALEPIHFTGHHSMGPLVGPQYFLKDLIYQNVTLQQDYFLGDSFRPSEDSSRLSSASPRGLFRPSRSSASSGQSWATTISPAR